MSLDGILSGMDISASGLRAERLRMEVVANNVANARSTRTLGGGPYQRQQVLFSSLMESPPGQRGFSASTLRGVDVVGVVPDEAPPHRVYDPGHPDADSTGHVAMPNVSLPREMVDLMTASRAYEANLKAIQTFRQMAEQALALLRGV